MINIAARKLQANKIIQSDFNCIKVTDVTVNTPIFEAKE